MVCLAHPEIVDTAVLRGAAHLMFPTRLPRNRDALRSIKAKRAASRDSTRGQLEAHRVRSLGSMAAPFVLPTEIGQTVLGTIALDGSLRMYPVSKN